MLRNRKGQEAFVANELGSPILKTIKKIFEKIKNSSQQHVSATTLCRKTRLLDWFHVYHSVLHSVFRCLPLAVHNGSELEKSFLKTLLYEFPEIRNDVIKPLHVFNCERDLLTLGQPFVLTDDDVYDFWLTPNKVVVIHLILIFKMKM